MDGKIISPFYLGVVGSRRRTTKVDYEIVQRTILDYYQIHKRNLIIVSGGCSKGADNFAEYVANKYGIPILIFYPNKQDKPNTGSYKADYAIVAYARNTEIAMISNSLLALVAEDRKGGTENTIKTFQKYHQGYEILIK